MMEIAHFRKAFHLILPQSVYLSEEFKFFFGKSDSFGGEIFYRLIALKFVVSPWEITSEKSSLQ